mmetsp:Transcript_23722/g.35829  ORF Transcript_23722/g.35829 Transcript_23722/m.35829 type:complete len:115 (+) Transcript_23722:42-386(+)
MRNYLPRLLPQQLHILHDPAHDALSRPIDKRPDQPHPGAVTVTANNCHDSNNILASSSPGDLDSNSQRRGLTLLSFEARKPKLKPKDQVSEMEKSLTKMKPLARLGSAPLHAVQ